jgi:hypothetical protein
MYKPLLILSNPYERVSMNFMMCFLEWQGKDAILMVVDKFPKLAKFWPIKITTTTMETIKFFF